MKNAEKSALIPLIREDLRETFTPYSSAASEMGKIDGAHYLNANENPYPFNGLEGYERYDVQQPPALIEALAKNYDTNKDYIVATRGSDESIDLMIRMFCESGKDAILTCPPTFGMYKVYGSLQGAKEIQVPLIQADRTFSLDIDNIIATAKDPGKHVKMVFLCCPNSPTGNLFPPAEIEKIIKELEGHAAVIVDEAYINFTDQPSFVTKLEQYPNLIVLRTLSKVHALAGERLGCAICADTAFTSFMRGCLAPYPIAKSVAANAIEALAQAETRQKDMIRKIIKERQDMSAKMQKCKEVEYVYPSETNFILVKFKSYDEAQNFLKRAATQNIILRDVSSKEDTKNCLRISVGTAEETGSLGLLASNVREIDARDTYLQKFHKKLREEGKHEGYIMYCMDLFDYHDDDMGVYFVHCETKQDLKERLKEYYLGLNFQQAIDCCLYVIDLKDTANGIQEKHLQYAELWADSDAA